MPNKSGNKLSPVNWYEKMLILIATAQREQRYLERQTETRIKWQATPTYTRVLYL